MSLFGTLWTVAEVGWSLPAAAREAADVFVTHGPLAAIDAFSARTDGLLPAPVAAEARALARQVLQLCHVGAGACVALADGLTRARPAVDRVIGVVIDVGYALGSWHTTLALWLEDEARG